MPALELIVCVSYRKPCLGSSKLAPIIPATVASPFPPRPPITAIPVAFRFLISVFDRYTRYTVALYLLVPAPCIFCLPRLLTPDVHNQIFPYFQYTALAEATVEPVPNELSGNALLPTKKQKAATKTSAILPTTFFIYCSLLRLGY